MAVTMLGPPLLHQRTRQAQQVAAVWREAEGSRVGVAACVCPLVLLALTPSEPLLSPTGHLRGVSSLGPVC